MGINLTSLETLTGLADAIDTAANLGELTLSQLQVFLLVAKHNGITGQDITNTLGISAANASRTLAILSNEQIKTRLTPCLGLITYKSTSQDKRKRLAHLTEKGEELAHRLSGCFRSNKERVKEKAEWDGELLSTEYVQRTRVITKDVAQDIEDLELYWCRQLEIDHEEMFDPKPAEKHLIEVSIMEDFVHELATEGDLEADFKRNQRDWDSKDMYEDPEIEWSYDQHVNRLEMNKKEEAEKKAMARKARRLIADRNTKSFFAPERGDAVRAKAQKSD